LSHVTFRQDDSRRTVVSRILLAGKDWQSRALLRAQLLEEGFDVEAHESVSEALATLAPGATLPDLFIADVSASDNPSADVESLSTWTLQVPTWIIASRSYIIEKGLRGHGFEMILLRPVDLGELVEQIKRRLDKDSHS
jgi:CheY-like chemotaxis protein